LIGDYERQMVDGRFADGGRQTGVLLMHGSFDLTESEVRDKVI